MFSLRQSNSQPKIFFAWDKEGQPTIVEVVKKSPEVANLKGLDIDMFLSKFEEWKNAEPSERQGLYANLRNMHQAAGINKASTVFGSEAEMIAFGEYVRKVKEIRASAATYIKPPTSNLDIAKNKELIDKIQASTITIDGKVVVIESVGMAQTGEIQVVISNGEIGLITFRKEGTSWILNNIGYKLADFDMDNKKITIKKVPPVITQPATPTPAPVQVPAAAPTPAAPSKLEKPLRKPEQITEGNAKFIESHRNEINKALSSYTDDAKKELNEYLNSPTKESIKKFQKSVWLESQDGDFRDITLSKLNEKGNLDVLYANVLGELRKIPDLEKIAGDNLLKEFGFRLDTKGAINLPYGLNWKNPNDKNDFSLAIDKGYEVQLGAIRKRASSAPSAPAPAASAPAQTIDFKDEKDSVLAILEKAKNKSMVSNLNKDESYYNGSAPKIIDYAIVKQSDGEFYVFDKPKDGKRTVYRTGNNMEVIGVLQVDETGGGSRVVKGKPFSAPYMPTPVVTK